MGRLEQVYSWGDQTRMAKYAVSTSEPDDVRILLEKGLQITPELLRDALIAGNFEMMRQCTAHALGETACEIEDAEVSEYIANLMGKYGLLFSPQDVLEALKYLSGLKWSTASFKSLRSGGDGNDRARKRGDIESRVDCLRFMSHNCSRFTSEQGLEAIEHAFSEFGCLRKMVEDGMRFTPEQALVAIRRGLREDCLYLLVEKGLRFTPDQALEAIRFKLPESCLLRLIEDDLVFTPEQALKAIQEGMSGNCLDRLIADGLRFTPEQTFAVMSEMQSHMWAEAISEKCLRDLIEHSLRFTPEEAVIAIKHGLPISCLQMLIEEGLRFSPSQILDVIVDGIGFTFQTICAIFDRPLWKEFLSEFVSLSDDFRCKLRMKYSKSCPKFIEAALDNDKIEFELSQKVMSKLKNLYPDNSEILSRLSQRGYRDTEQYFLSHTRPTEYQILKYDGPPCRDYCGFEGPLKLISRFPDLDRALQWLLHKILELGGGGAWDNYIISEDDKVETALFRYPWTGNSTGHLPPLDVFIYYGNEDRIWSIETVELIKKTLPIIIEYNRKYKRRRHRNCGHYVVKLQ